MLMFLIVANLVWIAIYVVLWSWFIWRVIHPKQALDSTVGLNIHAKKGVGLGLISMSLSTLMFGICILAMDRVPSYKDSWDLNECIRIQLILIILSLIFLRLVHNLQEDSKEMVAVDSELQKWS